MSQSKASLRTEPHALVVCSSCCHPYLAQMTQIQQIVVVGAPAPVKWLQLLLQKVVSLKPLVRRQTPWTSHSKAFLTGNTHVHSPSPKSEPAHVQLSLVKSNSEI